MYRIHKSLIVLFLNLLLSMTGQWCAAQLPIRSRQSEDLVQLATKGRPILSAAEIAKDFDAFWEYFSKYAQMYQDYPTFDENGKKIDRGRFLEAIDSGSALPLVVQGRGGMRIFKLAQLPKNAVPNIRLLLMNYANRELIYYRMEGKPVPAFNFTTITGKHYTPLNTRGKIILFKCWFINCPPCIAEMPALNKLVAKYKGRKDILFISLAMDQKKPLQQFLRTTRFDYETVPDQTVYMANKLHVQSYPTHYLIDRKGLLVKVPPDEATLEKYLERLLAKK